MKSTIIFILKHPITLLFSIAIGIYIGMANASLGTSLDVYATVYLLLLNMTVLPFIISAIVCSINKFLANTYLKNFFVTIVFYVLVVSFIFSIIGMSVGVLFVPGKISQDNRRILSEQININEAVEINLNSQNETNVNFLNFLLKIIPSNIFDSLSSSNVFAILMFSILFGIAIGSLPNKLKTNRKYLIVGFFEELYEVFSMLISYIILFLPFFLVCITASEVAKAGMPIIAATSKLIIVFYVLGLILLIVSTIVLAISVKQNLLSTSLNIAYPTLATFGIRNNIAAMSLSIDTLTSKFNVNYIFAKSVFPLVMIIGRFGNIIYFAIAILFSAQLYGAALGFMFYLFLVGAMVVISLATFGLTGVSTLVVFSVLVSFMGIPVETTMVFLIAIDIVMEPLRNAITIHTNTTITSLLYACFKRRQIQKDTQQ